MFEPLERRLLARFDVDWRWPVGSDPETWESVAVESCGVELAGAYGPSEGTPGGLLVLVHPWDVRAKGFFLGTSLAQDLRGRGYDVFLFDMAGFGESERGGIQFPADVAAAIETALRVSPCDRYGALGVSLGGASLVAALTRADTAAEAVVLDSTFASLSAFWRRYDARLWPLVRTWMLVHSSRARELSPRRVAPSVTDVDRLLLINGENDEYTPPSDADELESAFGVSDDCIDRWVPPNVSHTSTVNSLYGDYLSRVCEVFEAGFASG